MLFRGQYSTPNALRYFNLKRNVWDKVLTSKYYYHLQPKTDKHGTFSTKRAQNSPRFQVTLLIFKNKWQNAKYVRLKRRVPHCPA